MGIGHYLQMNRPLYTWTSPSLSTESSELSSVFSGIFRAEDIAAVREQGSGDIKMLHIWTPLEAFVKMSLRSVFFNDEFFSGKNQNFQSWDKSPQVLNYQNFCTTRHQINGILLYCNSQFSSGYVWIIILIHNITTRSNTNIYPPVCNLTVFQKGAYFSGIKLFTHLPLRKKVFQMG